MTTQKIALLRWYVIVHAIAIMFLLLQFTGLLFPYLLTVDHSRLTLVNLGLFIGVSSFIGWLHYKLLVEKRPWYLVHLKPCWFAADSMMAIGMMGTLVGFMLIFSENMSHIDTTNVDTVKTVVVQLTKGFSTSIVTTLVGIGLATLTKLQLVNLEHGLEHNE